ncbi:MATE family efflux transporter [Thalassotalea profundi]|uniref:MATE family efflux transporter n=1 Tax=Thalassotalea profundi TaxID=2036687 RepID=A0ABQ3IYA2_9GAMM|nr:MATE family efflux transporter [Thalassotalea profundi]GHE96873.1 MATE family efflux transporter [Thalassotalea profundi]
MKSLRNLPHKQLFSLAIPMILSNITVPLLGLVDTAVIGHLEHSYFLGGSTVGAMVITFIIWFSGFLRMSTTGLAAQAYGKSSAKESQLVLLRGIVVAIMIGLTLILFQGPYLNATIYFAGGSPEVQFYAKEYSEIRIFGLPAAIANLVILGWLLGNHRAKAVMWILIITNLTNLGLDLLFVWGFGWQVKGVAWATLIAEYIGLFVGCLIIFLTGMNTRLKHEKWRIVSTKEIFNKAALSGYFKLNRDIMIRTLLLQSCFIFITFQGARLGDDVVAANAILMNFLLLISFGLDGIANAAEVMVGNASGRNQQSQLKQATLVSTLWTIIFAIIYSIIFLIFGDKFIGLISNIESVVTLANSYLLWIVALPLVACWSYLLDGIYIGLMQAKTMRNSMIVATLLGFYPAWFMLKDFENQGLWGAFFILMLLRGTGLAWHFYFNIWTKKSS